MGIVELEGRVIAIAGCQREEDAELRDVIIEVLRDLEQESGQQLVCDDGIASETTIVITGDPIDRPRVDVINAGDSAISRAVELLIRRLPATLVQRDISEHVEGEAGPVRQDESAVESVAIGIVMGVNDESSAWAGAGTLLDKLAVSGDLGSAIVIGSPGEQSLVAQHAANVELLGIDPSQYEVRQVVASIDEELRRRYRERLGAELGDLDGAVSFVPRGLGLDLVARFVGRLQNRQVWNIALPGGLACAGDEPGNGVVLDGPLEIAPGHLAGLIDRSQLFESATCRELAGLVRADHNSNHDATSRYARTLASALALKDLVPELPAGCDTFIWGQACGGAVDLLAILDGTGATARRGILHVLGDADGLGTLLGALAEDWPAMAADSVLLDLLEPQGAVVQITGDGDDGDLAISGRIERRDHPTIYFAIPFGSVQCFDLHTWSEATLSLQCEPRARIGDQPAKLLRLSGADLLGGELLIDARRLHDGRNPTMAQIASWLADLDENGSAG